MQKKQREKDRVLQIPKRGGGFRTVVACSRQRVSNARYILPKLQATAIALDIYDVQHGFTPGRSPVTNAAQHVGYQWSVCFDLKDCFDHVTRERVERVLGCGTGAHDNVYHNDVARQGIPTSPALANIALSKVDAQIVNALDGRGVYTRYADDLTISTNDYGVVEEMQTHVRKFVSLAGFCLNHKKTRVQSAKAGRRIITGVAVDDAIHPRRKDKRRLRAAEHQRNAKQARGLREWCRLKRPNTIRKALRLLNEGVYGVRPFLANMIVERD